MKRVFQIWMEGYRVTGNSDGASFLGEIEAESFQEACDKFLENDPGWKDLYSSKNRSIWGCRLFDNEEDARKSFG